MRLIAGGLLLVMAVILGISVAYEAQFPRLSWVRAFAEAAMVGGLADWFAVTALFRHPMGIPIPHTAIVPARRDEIAQMLGRFFRNNFLSEHIVRGKMESVDPAGLASKWLHSGENRKRVRKVFKEFTPYLNALLEDESIRRLFERSAEQALREADLSALAGKFLEVLVEGDRDEVVMSEIARIGEMLVERHKAFLRDRLRDEMPWYVPNFVHDKIYARVINRIGELLHELRTLQRSEIRTFMRRAVSELIVNLKESEYMHEQGERLKEWLLMNQVVRAYSSNLWREIRRRLSNEMARGESIAGYLIDRALRGFSESAAKDSAVRSRINNMLTDVVVATLQLHGQEVVSLVSDTIRGWDTKTLVNKIELQVGRDLQYIRLNGTIVGGLAGLLIHAVMRFTASPLF